MSGGGFSLDQLMELAGLSVSQAGIRLHAAGENSMSLIIDGSL